MSLAYDAMMFARDAHKNQVRKFTGDPYWVHLAEVAGIVAATGVGPETLGFQARTEIGQAVAWTHDCREDQGVTHSKLQELFGQTVADGVDWLSDLEEGANRADRKAQSRRRLRAAPGWVQSIKCADLISNTASIIKHDPKFAIGYLGEKRLLLDVMTKADPRLLEMARTQAMDPVHSILQSYVFEGATTKAVDALMSLCPDEECRDCSRIVCPQSDRLHFHHDGCPSCNAS